MINFQVNPLLLRMLAKSERVSDLNFSVGRAPQVEVDGNLHAVEIPGLTRLMPWHTESVAMGIMGGRKQHMDELARRGSVDLSYAIPGKTRFRVNIFFQRGSLALVLRVIPAGMPNFEELGLPEEILRVAQLKNGIVLVTGPTGSGKSTTLAAIVDEINRTKPVHILTIEDPIEYMHRHQKGTVNQREVGGDVPNFAFALRAALRQAPKVILIGEMRDLETIETAFEAAETGHLVLSTLHTIDAAKTVDRIVGVFPKDQENQVRLRFAQTFRHVISQRLVPKPEKGRVAVLEILKSTLRTREYIVKGESEGRSLLDAIKDGDQEGMQSFDRELEKLVRAKVITIETALAYATNANNLALEMSDLRETQE